MQAETEKFLFKVLDQIEQGEARLLTWGLVDGVLDQRELEALIGPAPSTGNLSRRPGD